MYHLWSESPAPPLPIPDSFTKPGTRLLIADMDVPKILALMVILLLNLQYSQTQGTCRGNYVNSLVRLFTDIAIILHCGCVKLATAE